MWLSQCMTLPVSEHLWFLTNKQTTFCNLLTSTRLSVCFLLLHQDLNLAHEMGHGCSRIVSQLAWSFRMLSILQCLSSCLSTSSLSSTLATNHCKGSQLFTVSVLTGLVLLIFQVAVPRPSDSYFQHCQSSCWPNLSSLCQAAISLNINDSFYV